MSEIDDARKELTEPSKPKATIPFTDFVSTGSTLINLACTGRPACGFAKGHYYFVVGDSASGKTWGALSCFAEAAQKESFDDYVFVYDAPEGGALMDIEHYFGADVLKRLKAPATKDGEPRHSLTVEEFYFNLFKWIKDKKVIYVLDSMDVVPSEEDLKTQEKRDKILAKKQSGKTLTKKDEEGVGTYGMGKAKCNSQNLRLAMPMLQKTGSILIIISQTRDNIQTFSFEKKTRAGGHALKFYATLELWMSIVEKVKKRYKGKERTQGIVTKVQVKKNRVTGRDRSVKVPILFSYGIDDVGSMVDYLVDEDHWKVNGSEINAKELGFKGSREEIIHRIESNDKEKELRRVVKEVWEDIEDGIAVKRKPRYE